MKYLILLRHAKSSWKDLSLSDHDRPLNKRGRNSAPVMGQRLNLKSIQPDLVLSSTANRALSTAHIVITEMDTKPQIETTKHLYHAWPEEMLIVASHVHDEIDALMLVGHNPGMTDLANQLLSGSEHFGNIPTAGLVTIKLNINTWKDININGLQGILVDYDYPKKS